MISFTLVNLHLGGIKLVLQVYFCETTFMCTLQTTSNPNKASFFRGAGFYPTQTLPRYRTKNNLNVLGKEAMEKVVNIFFNHKNIETIEEYKAG